MADGIRHIVRDHQRGQMIFGNDLVGDLQHLCCRGGIQRSSVFIEKEQLRFTKRRHQKRQRLALPAREQADLHLQPILQTEAEHFQPFPEKISVLLCHHPAERTLFAAPSGNGQVFFDPHVRRGAHHRILEDTADQPGTFVLRQPGYVFPSELDGTAVNRPNAGNGVQHRALPCSVASDHGYEIAFFERQAQVIQCLLLIDGARIEGLGDLFYFQHVSSPPHSARQPAFRHAQRMFSTDFSDTAQRGRRQRSPP